MRFSYLATAAALLVPALARRTGQTSPNPGADLAKRAVYANACATITIQLPTTVSGICTADPSLALCSLAANLAGTALQQLLALNGGNLVASYCLCITGNLLDTATLTANSNQKLYAAVPTSLISQLGDDPAPALGGTPVVTHTINLLNYLAPGLIQEQTSSCDYPEHSIPTCTKSCSFLCETNYQICGELCIPAGSPCSSTAAQHPNYGRRSLAERAACPLGFSACPIPGIHKTGRYECLDTASNVESCGGCMTPFPGNAAGKDCTAIVGSEEVDCLRGKCEVVSCEPGYLLVKGACELAQGVVDGAATSQRVLGKGKRGVKNVFKERRAARRAIIDRAARK